MKTKRKFLLGIAGALMILTTSISYASQPLKPETNTIFYPDYIPTWLE